MLAIHKIILAFVGVLIFLSVSPVFSQQAAMEVNGLLAQAKASPSEEAVPFLEAALQLCQRQTCEDSLRGKIYHQLSLAYFQGYIDDDQAIAFADTAIHYFEKEYDSQHPILANEYYNRGMIRVEVGQAVGAADITEALRQMKGNTILPSATTDSISAYWHQEIAKTYRRQRNFQLADDYAKIGLVLAGQRWAKPHTIKGDLLRSLGNVRYDRNDYAGAINYFKQARAVYEKIYKEGALELLRTDQNLGLAYSGLEQHDLAIQHHRRVENYLDQAFRVKPQKNLLKDWANTHINLLAAEAGRGSFAAANAHFEQGLSLLDRLFDERKHWLYAELFNEHTRSLIMQNNLSAANTYSDRALEVLMPNYRKDAPPTTFIGPLEHVLKAFRLRAEILEEEGREQEALLAYEYLHELITAHRQQELSGWSKFYLVADVLPVYEAAIRLNVKLFKATGKKNYLESAYAFNSRNKAIILREQLQHEQAIAFMGLPAEVQQRETTLREKLEGLNQSINKLPKPAILDSLQALRIAAQQDYTVYVRSLEHKYPRYYKLKYAPSTQVTSKEIQQKLAKNQVIIEYFSGIDTLYTFLITPEKFELYTTAQPEGLREQITLYHELLTTGISEECEQLYLELSYDLYQYLLAEPLATIEHQEYRRLLIIPDGLLHFVAFETLLTRPRETLAGSSDLILERYATSYHYSTYFFVHPFGRSETRSPAKRFGGFGAEYDDITLKYLEDVFAKKTPALGEGQTLPCSEKTTRRYLGKLYHSDDEVKNIAEKMAGDYWLNDAVTKQTFLQEMSEYEILHLALHGSYDLDYPMSSALAFTKTTGDDALLTAGEVYALDLDCSMIVLSACNTSFGKLMPGEGVMTLARAFNYAGGAAVVASLWSLPDRSTSVIMDGFYAELQKGLPKDIALQNAKLNYLNQDDLSTPSTRLPTFWGAAVIIGDTRPITTPFFTMNKLLMAGGFVVFLTFLLGWYRRAK